MSVSVLYYLYMICVLHYLYMYSRYWQLTLAPPYDPYDTSSPKRHTCILIFTHVYQHTIHSNTIRLAENLEIDQSSYEYHS